jgi:hypothetical protein
LQLPDLQALDLMDAQSILRTETWEIFANKWSIDFQVYKI